MINAHPNVCNKMYTIFQVGLYISSKLVQLLVYVGVCWCSYVVPQGKLNNSQDLIGFDELVTVV